MKKIVAIVTFFFLALSYSLNAQQEIKGVITNSQDGSSVPGVTVVIKGTDLGTISNSNGQYTISLSENDSILVFSSIGFAIKEMNVKGMSEVNVSLETEFYSMDEVIVIGYGDIKKSDLTGAIDKVDVDNLQQTPTTTFETALQGKTSGVYMSGSSGKLGEAYNIKIRGTASISAGAQPLYVIDNCIIQNDYISRSDNQPLNPLMTLDPHDIESIEILKDAEACAIYGSRASNGVVIITTKSGANTKKNEINAGYSFSIQKETNRIDMLNGKEYLELLTEAAENAGWYIYEGYNSGREQVLDYLYLTDDDTLNNYDWQDEIFRNGTMKDFYINSMGANKSTSYYAGFSYSTQEGILVGNDFERINGRLSLTNNVNKYIDFTANINYVQTNLSRLPDDNAFANPMQMIAQSPLISPYLEDGTPNLLTYYPNGLLDLEYNDESNKINRTTLNLRSNVKLLNEKLKFTSVLASDILNQNENVRFSALTEDGLPNGKGEFRDVKNSNFSSENFITFEETLNDDHQFKLVTGVSYQSNIYYRTQASAQVYPGDDFTDLDAAAEAISAGSLNTETYFSSEFSRLNYNFRKKYLASASIRRDKSNKFGPDNRAGVFYAFSAGWIMSKEDFIKQFSYVSFLKPRISYGTTGNANIPELSYMNLVSPQSYAGQPGVSLTQVGYSDLGWENTSQLDIGIDYGFLNNRLYGEMDYYIKNTTDLLLLKHISAANGVSELYENVGGLKNEGFEFGITGKPVVGDINWDVSFNIATNKNEVTKLIAPIEFTLHAVEEGKPIGFFKMPEYAGVDPQTGDALYYDANNNVTNDYSQADWRMVGDPNPKYYGGITNKVTYADFDITVFFQFVGNVDAYRQDNEFLAANGDWFDNQTKEQLNRWRNPGDITDVPQARLGEYNGNLTSSRYLNDASYLRLKELTIGYNLPQKISKKAQLQLVRFYFTSRNLLTFTKYDGFDPEIGTPGVGTDITDFNIQKGIEYFTAPQAMSFTFGVNVTF